MALAFLRVSVKSTFHPRPLVAVTSSSFTSTKPTTRRTPLSRAISSASSGTDRNMAESVDSTGKTSTSHEHPHQQKAKEQHMDGPNEWKTRPPYRIGDETDGFKARWNASCHCGQVQYQLSRETALDSKLCHCTTCQKQHGIFPRLQSLSQFPNNPSLFLYLCYSRINWRSMHQPHHFNGPPSSTKPISSSNKAIMTWSGTIRVPKASSISCRAKSGARIATVRSWTKGGI